MGSLRVTCEDVKMAAHLSRWRVIVTSGASECRCGLSMIQRNQCCYAMPLSIWVKATAGWTRMATLLGQILAFLVLAAPVVPLHPATKLRSIKMSNSTDHYTGDMGLWEINAAPLPAGFEFPRK